MNCYAKQKVRIILKIKNKGGRMKWELRDFNATIGKIKQIEVNEITKNIIIYLFTGADVALMIREFMFGLVDKDSGKNGDLYSLESFNRTILNFSEEKIVLKFPDRLKNRSLIHYYFRIFVDNGGFKNQRFYKINFT